MQNIKARYKVGDVIRTAWGTTRKIVDLKVVYKFEDSECHWDEDELSSGPVAMAEIADILDSYGYPTHTSNAAARRIISIIRERGLADESTD